MKHARTNDSLTIPEFPLSLVSVAQTAAGSVGDGGGGPSRVSYLQLSIRTSILAG